MKKRIIRETRVNGEISYVVEKKFLFFGWRTATVYHELCPLDAVFDTLEEAEKYCGIDTNPVVNRDVLITLP